MIAGKFIGVKEKRNTYVVEKSFTLVGNVKKAALKITALGLYFAEINGKRVGNAYLTPGWTSYQKTLQMQTYDVADMLKAGLNKISITVNDGWYCGALKWLQKINTYGGQSAVCAELDTDGEKIITDETWTARESHIRESGIYDGETIDYICEPKPLKVSLVPFDKKRIVPQIGEPVRNIERLSVKKEIALPNGDTVYDFGQNFAGVVEIRTPKDYRGTFVMQFAEILVDGEFYTENLREAKATDVITVCGEKTISPEFTYHGFRYLKISGVNFDKSNITGIVRHTDMKRTGKIRVDNVRVQRLIDNALWSQKSNFVDIPTDCPQRDERIGWTGDINMFLPVAAFHYDVGLFMKKWLKTLRDDQSETGEIPYWCPDGLMNDKHTAAVWCDCIVFIPWNLYNIYGDKSFLSDNYEAMKKFVAAKEKTMVNGLIAKGYEYGDWLALDVDAIQKNAENGRTDVYFISNVFHSECLKILSDTAKILGDEKAIKLYSEKYKTLLANIRKEYFTRSGRLAVDTATAQVLALHFNIVQKKYRRELAEKLNENVENHRFRVSTGFAGTSFLLVTLAENGYFETARRLLFNNACPGWLYEVDMGATTIWERWNALQADGKPNPDGMNSYNHYAYGAVVLFIIEKIAGIERKTAGYKKIRLAPTPAIGLDEIQAEYDSPSGKIISGYKQELEKIIYTFEVPEGVQAEIVLPDERPMKRGGGKYTFERAGKAVAYQPFTPDSDVDEVFNNPVAAEIFNEVFDGLFCNNRIPSWIRSNRSLKFMAEYMAGRNEMQLKDFSKKLELANKKFLEKTSKKINCLQEKYYVKKRT